MTISFETYNPLTMYNVITLPWTATDTVSYENGVCFEISDNAHNSLWVYIWKVNNKYGLAIYEDIATVRHMLTLDETPNPELHTKAGLAATILLYNKRRFLAHNKYGKIIIYG